MVAAIVVGLVNISAGVAGLIMLGGRDSFGAGGWMNTPVEKALPVDMEIKALKVQGNEAHAQTAGVLCTKVSRYAERSYHPDRLLHPLRAGATRRE